METKTFIMASCPEDARLVAHLLGKIKQQENILNKICMDLVTKFEDIVKEVK